MARLMQACTPTSGRSLTGDLPPTLLAFSSHWRLNSSVPQISKRQIPRQPVQLPTTASNTNHGVFFRGHQLRTCQLASKINHWSRPKRLHQPTRSRTPLPNVYTSTKKTGRACTGTRLPPSIHPPKSYQPSTNREHPIRQGHSPNKGACVNQPMPPQGDRQLVRQRHILPQVSAYYRRAFSQKVKNLTPITSVFHNGLPSSPHQLVFVAKPNA